MQPCRFEVLKISSRMKDNESLDKAQEAVGLLRKDEKVQNRKFCRPPREKKLLKKEKIEIWPAPRGEDGGPVPQRPIT